MDQAQKLISHILSHPETCESDGAAYELLGEYQQGSPIESLRDLLFNPDDRIAGEATWIASELPDAGLLLRDIGILLKHRSKKVRFWAIDCIQLWAGPSDGSELATAFTLVDDVDKAVRWNAMGFLAMASVELIMAALDYLCVTDPKSPYVNELIWLTTSREGADPREITAALRSSDDRRRKIASVAASRLAKENSEPLVYAASLEDSEIAQFAADMLKRIRPS